MDDTWAHHNALFATIKQRLRQSIIMHPIQASHTASQERLQNPTCDGTTNKTTRSGNNKQYAICH